LNVVSSCASCERVPAESAATSTCSRGADWVRREPVIGLGRNKMQHSLPD
jgi:hypothetical protein